METHSGAPDPRRASDLLAELDADRGALARHAATPAWYLVGMTVLAGVYVATPLLGDHRSPLTSLLLGGLLVLGVLHQQRRVVRPRGLGAAGAGLLVGLLAVVLLLLSVSFGLVAGGLRGWVVLPAVVAAAATALALRRLDALARRDLARVR